MINAKITADSALNESEILKYVIKEDLDSLSKRKMEEGEKYYAYEHDILKKILGKAEFRKRKTTEKEAKKRRLKTFLIRTEASFIQ